MKKMSWVETLAFVTGILFITALGAFFIITLMTNLAVCGEAQAAVVDGEPVCQ